VARIRIANGPFLAAMPLATQGDPACSQCKNHNEMKEESLRRLNAGDDWSAVSLAEDWFNQVDGHTCDRYVDRFGMNPRRGDWISVACHTTIYDPDLKRIGEELRIMVGRADVLVALPKSYEGGRKGRFTVIDSPGNLNEGRICQYWLDHLEVHEIIELFHDLKAV
jgi:hypothetical protein